jgi:hypothetical protein
MNKCTTSSEGCGLHMTHEGVAGQPLRRRLSAVLILLCSSSQTKKRTFGGACIVHVVAKCGECISGLLRKSYADLDEYVVVVVRFQVSVLGDGEVVIELKMGRSLRMSWI